MGLIMLGGGAVVNVAASTDLSDIDALTGTGTTVVMQNAPSITSPVLTTPTVTTRIEPTTDDGAALGQASKQFADLFLASGAVINFNGGDVTLTHAPNLLTLAGGQFVSSGFRNSGAGFFGLGTGEAVTIATGVATVTKPYVILDAEGAGTTDQLDSITYTGVADGDLLLLVTTATDTITVDDANINLGAATRAIAPGGCLLLRYDGGEAQWTEVIFLASADNV